LACSKKREEGMTRDRLEQLEQREKQGLYENNDPLMQTIRHYRLPIAFIVGLCAPMFIPLMLYLDHKAHKLVKPSKAP